MRIAQRLRLGLGAIVGLAVALAAIGYWGSSTLALLTLRTLRVEAQLASRTHEVATQVAELRRQEKDIFLNVGTPQQAVHHSEWRATRRKLDATFSALETIARQQADATARRDLDTLRTLRSGLADYERYLAPVLAGTLDGRLRTPQQAAQALAPHEASINLLLASSTAFAESRAQEVGKELVAGQRRVRTVVALSALVALAVAFATTRRIAVGLARAQAAVEQAAAQAAQREQVLSLVGDMRSSLAQLLEDVRTARSRFDAAPAAARLRVGGATSQEALESAAAALALRAEGLQRLLGPSQADAPATLHRHAVEQALTSPTFANTVKES